jgi:hypothetical protein
MEIKKLDKAIEVKSYRPTDDEKILQTFIAKRRDQMQDFRRSLGIEKEWKEADIEYVPHELEFGTPRKRFETDQDTGLRSRMVPIGDQTQNWRSNSSAPTLLVKIQTAFSIMIDQNPEAMLTALKRQYEDTTQLAYSLWKRNWAITDGKEVLKLVVFDMLKYGWGVGRSYPRKITYTKAILTEYDSENPEKNKYETREITWFNDVTRERLTPYKTWIDEQTKPYDVYSMNDCYYEVDFSYDAAKVEFGQYKNWDLVKPDSKVATSDEQVPATTENQAQLSERSDIVTIGFYENRAKDLFTIWVPKDKIILHKCPLPNDDGMLSLWQAPWILRGSDSPYGISVWKIIRQDKELYDKMMNMTSDQLVLSIMKFGFHTGTSGVLGDGIINIVPGQSKQITNGKFDWMEIPGPGQEAWKGLEYKSNEIDKNSGITPTIEGDVTGKTLGEIQLAREAALKRLKVPLNNIAWAIEQDAYLTLSWMKQVYSTPEVKEFANDAEILKYEQEMGVNHDELFEKKDETGEQVGLTATFLPELSLNLDIGDDGKLMESEESRFFQIGKDITTKQLNWKGVFKVIPRSLLDTSETIMKQTKTEMANMLIPMFLQPPELVKKAAMQLIKINEEDPQDWLPDSWLMPPAPEEEQIDTESLFLGPEGEGMEAMDPAAHEAKGQHTVQNRSGMTAPTATKMVPGGQVSSTGISLPASGPGKMFNQG